MVTLYCIAYHYKVKDIRKVSHIILNVMDLDEVLMKHAPHYKYRDVPDPEYHVDYDTRIQLLLIVSFLRQLMYPVEITNIYYTADPVCHREAKIHIEDSIDEALNKCNLFKDETEKIKREQFDTDGDTKQLTVKFIW